MGGDFSGGPLPVGASADELKAKIAELADGARAAEGGGDIETAVTRFQKAALLAKSLGDEALVGELLVDGAGAFTQIGEFRQAARFLERAREIARDRDLAELKGEVYRGFGGLYKARGELDEAAVCFDRALERLEFSSRHRSVARVLLELGEVYMRQGRFAQASHLLKRAENLPSSGDPALAVRLALCAGRLSYAAGDRTAAIAAYRSALEAASAAERPFEREMVALGLAGLLAEDGRAPEALERLREALALSIVSFALEGARPVLRARFTVIEQRLLEIEVAAEKAGADRPLRRGVEEAVRLFNAHPLVLTGEARPYGTVDAVVEARGPPRGQAPARFAPAENVSGTRLPNPK